MSENNLSSSRLNYVFGVAVLLAVVSKILTVWHYGPMALGDNNGFINAAEEILSSNQWLLKAGENDSVFPPTLWRPIGYSLIISGFKTLFGGHWAIALCTFQASLSLLTGLLLYKLCLKANLSQIAASTVFLLYEWSAPLSTDALVMEDALTGTLGMVSFLALLFPIVQNKIPSAHRFFLVGSMAAIAFLIRDVYHFVMPVLAFITLVIMTRLKGVKVGLTAAGALVLPVILMSSLLQSWNYQRTGSPVTTTAGQSAYIYAVIKAAQYDARIIAGDDVLSTTIREENKTFEYYDTGQVNAALFKNHKMNSIEQAKAASRLFWGTLFTNPVPMIKAALARVRIVQQGTLFSGPVTRLDDLLWWSQGTSSESFYSTGWRAEAQEFRKTLKLSSLTPEVVFHLGLRTIVRILGVVALAVFLVGTPWLWLKMHKQLQGLAHAALISWGVYVLWVCMYIPVSFEVRYMSPLIGPALMTIAIIFFNFKELIPQRWASALSKRRAQS